MKTLLYLYVLFLLCSRNPEHMLLSRLSFFMFCFAFKNFISLCVCTRWEDFLLCYYKKKIPNIDIMPLID